MKPWLAIVTLTTVAACGAVVDSSRRDSANAESKPWSEITTDHFDIWTDLTGENRESLAVQVEQIYVDLKAAGGFNFPGRGEPSLVFRLIVFADKQAMDAVLLDHRFIGAVASEDLFPLPMTTLVLPAELAGASRRLLQRTLALALTGHYLGRAPAWLRVGLAEYDANLAFDDGDVVFGALPDDFVYVSPGGQRRHQVRGVSHVDILTLPSVAELTAAEPAVFRSGEAWRYRRAAQLLTYLLLDERRAYRPVFLDYCDRLSRGNDALSAFQATLGRLSRDQLEHDYRHAVDDGGHSWQSEVDTPRVGRPKMIRRVEPVDRVLLFAELHSWWAPSFDRADAELTAVSQARLALGEVAYWRAVLQFKRGDVTAAWKELLRATTAEPDNGRYALALALLVRRNDELTQSTRQSWLAPLHKLGEIASTPTQRSYAAVYYAEQNDLPHALELADTAVQVAPGCWRCWMNLANIEDRHPEIFRYSPHLNVEGASSLEAEATAPRPLPVELWRRADLLIPEGMTDQSLLDSLQVDRQRD